MKNKIIRNFIIGTFVSLYLLVSIISTIHVIDFFELSNPRWMAITLAIGFEIGAAASLASLIIMDKMNKTLVWSLFITITAMQINGNLYYAFINMQDYQTWVELFNLLEWEPLAQKRLLSAVSGAILPLVALGFIKSLVDYIKPSEDELITDDIAGFSDLVENEKKSIIKKEPVNEEPIKEEHQLEILDNTLNQDEDFVEEANDSFEYDIPEQEDDYIDDYDYDMDFERALEERAEQEKEDYLKNKEYVKSQNDKPK